MGVSANTTKNTFKTRLEKFWHNQDITHNFRAHVHAGNRNSQRSDVRGILVSYHIVKSLDEASGRHGGFGWRS